MYLKENYLLNRNIFSKLDILPVLEANHVSLVYISISCTYIYVEKSQKMFCVRPTHPHKINDLRLRTKMPAKRIIKTSSNKSKPPTLVPSTDKVDNKESTEAELRFDQEVLWCISQFEKLLSTGKLPDAKSKLIFDKRFFGSASMSSFSSSMSSRKNS